MNKMIFLALFLAFGFLVFGQVNHENELEEGKRLVESRMNCEKLTEEQLESIGEYLMELMHPGSAHEAMHEMMGLQEGSEEHKSFHVNLAKAMY